MSGISAAAAQSFPPSTSARINGRATARLRPVDTIGSAGCALTAVTMVTAAYGFSTNPQLLNRWLTATAATSRRPAALAAGARRDAGSVRWQWMTCRDRSSSGRMTRHRDLRHSHWWKRSSMRTAGGGRGAVHGNMHFVVITATAAASSISMTPGMATGPRSSTLRQLSTGGPLAQVYYATSDRRLRPRWPARLRTAGPRSSSLASAAHRFSNVSSEQRSIQLQHLAAGAISR